MHDGGVTAIPYSAATGGIEDRFWGKTIRTQEQRSEDPTN